MPEEFQSESIIRAETLKVSNFKNIEIEQKIVRIDMLVGKYCKDCLRRQKQLKGADLPGLIQAFPGMSHVQVNSSEAAFSIFAVRLLQV